MNVRLSLLFRSFTVKGGLFAKNPSACDFITQTRSPKQFSLACQLLYRYQTLRLGIGIINGARFHIICFYYTLQLIVLLDFNLFDVSIYRTDFTALSATPAYCTDESRTPSIYLFLIPRTICHACAAQPSTDAISLSAYPANNYTYTLWYCT